MKEIIVSVILFIIIFAIGIDLASCASVLYTTNMVVEEETYDVVGDD